MSTPIKLMYHYKASKYKIQQNELPKMTSITHKYQFCDWQKVIMYTGG